MNLDVAYIGEFVTRSGVSAFLDLPSYWAEMQDYLSSTDGTTADYYQAGIDAGKIVKSIFDLNINNWKRKAIQE